MRPTKKRSRPELATVYLVFSIGCVVAILAKAALVCHETVTGWSR